jgi:hypothetical protein
MASSFAKAFVSGNTTLDTWLVEMSMEFTSSGLRQKMSHITKVFF